jgi:predicted house-cleaning noncanonical NTP pyrophosphatase (MazG superfamily)
MDQFDLFMNDILSRKSNINPIEMYCYQKFRRLLSKKITNVNVNINIHDVCIDTYWELIKEGTQITCLKFSDGKKMYVDRKILIKIEFFNNYLADTNFDGFLIDLPLIGIIDDYETMDYIIKFIYNEECVYGYEIVNKLCKVNDYLIEVVSNSFKKKVIFSEETMETHTLKEYLTNIFTKFISEMIWNNKFEYQPNCFEMIYETWTMLGLTKISVSNRASAFYKYKDEIIKSSLSKMVNYC